jgi:hypothetical protein
MTYRIAVRAVVWIGVCCLSSGVGVKNRGMLLWAVLLINHKF